MTRFRLVLGALAGLSVGANAQSANGPIQAPAAKYQVSIQKDVMVPMRDGVRLATDIYRPEGAGDRLPVILMRTPYNKATYGGATAPAAFFAGQGYMVVTQDVRGQYGSEGFYRVQLADARDGYDAIDWIVKQPWATASVGMYGCSYLGEVQYLLSARRHPALKALIPQAASGATGPAGDYYTNFGTYDGGALTLSSIFGWFGFAGHRIKAPATTTVGVSNVPKIDFAAMLKTLPTATLAERSGFPPSDFKDFVTHPPADRYWAPIGYLKDTDEFDTPALHVNSWLDVTPEQTLYVANLMRKNAATARGRDNQFVIMSPTTHCGSERAGNPTKVGDREFGDSRQPYFQIYLDWFDHWLKGVDNGVTKRPKFHYYVMGENRWRASPSWPVPGMKPVNYYLHAGGALDQRVPAPGSQSFVYDPANPLPSRGGTICCTGNPADQPGIFDQTDLETRPALDFEQRLPDVRPEPQHRGRQRHRNYLGKGDEHRVLRTEAGLGVGAAGPAGVTPIPAGSARVVLRRLFSTEAGIEHPEERAETPPAGSGPGHTTHGVPDVWGCVSERPADLGLTDTGVSAGGQFER